MSIPFDFTKSLLPSSAALPSLLGGAGRDYDSMSLEELRARIAINADRNRQFSRLSQLGGFISGFAVRKALL